MPNYSIFNYEICFGRKKISASAKAEIMRGCAKAESVRMRGFDTMEGRASEQPPDTHGEGAAKGFAVIGLESGGAQVARNRRFPMA